MNKRNRIKHEMASHTIRKFKKRIADKPLAFVVVIVVAFIGMLFVVNPRAATFTANSEAENGALSGSASQQTDGTVSGGKAVKFGTATTSSWACTSAAPVFQNGAWDYSAGKNAAGSIVDSACGFPQDSVHFTGQNDSTSLDNEIDSHVWSPTCADALGDLVDTDDPTCVTPSTSTLQANSAQNFVITNMTPAGHNSVSAYSNVWAHGYTGVVDDYKTLTSTYNLSMPIDSHTSAWAMHDDWFKEPNSPNDWADYELMIQYDFTNNGDCPSSWNNGANDWGVVANNVMIDGVAWHVCDGENPMHADGTCDQSIDDSCGAIVFKLGATEADRPALPTTSGTINIKAMVTWLETHNVPGQNYPFMQKGSSVANLSAGWEICTTGGVPEKFYGNGFTVNATH